MRYIFTLFFTILLMGCQAGFYKGPITDHFDGEKFYYPGEIKSKENHFYELVGLLVAVIQNQWPKKLPSISYTTFPDHPNGMKIMFINHSTVLIQTRTVNFLIDPIYSYRASPFQWIGPKRVREPGVRYNDLPKIDVVLISHNHYDHMDTATLKALNKSFQPLFIVPLGNRAALHRLGIKKVIELDWWQKTQFKNADIIFLPAHHTAQRGLNDYNRTLWGSYGLQISGKKIYFAGDTSYNNHFKEIHAKWGTPDLAFLPIGAYKPRDLLKPYHMNPDDAVRSHLDLGSRQSMGIHWGTFQLAAESMDQPIIDLIVARKKWKVSEESFFVIQEGQLFYLDKAKTS